MAGKRDTGEPSSERRRTLPNKMESIAGCEQMMSSPAGVFDNTKSIQQDIAMNENFDLQNVSRCYDSAGSYSYIPKNNRKKYGRRKVY